MKLTLLSAFFFLLLACSQASDPSAATQSVSSTDGAEATGATADPATMRENAADEPPYKQAFHRKYPAARAIDWRKDDHGYHEAHFELDGKSLRADFTDDGRWVETERSVDYDELPDAVKAVVKDKYDPDDVVEVEFVDHAEKGQFYDVELEDKGEKFDVEITVDGRIIEIDD